MGLRSEKQFLGFSKDDSNYFFFQPEVDFDDINYKIKTVKDDTPGRSGYFTFGTVATAEPYKLNERDTFELELFGHAANLSSSMDCSSTEKLYASTEMLYFDNKGNPICISSRTGESKGVLAALSPDVCVEQNGKYVLPDNMKGELRCVISIIETMDEEQWAKKSLEVNLVLREKDYLQMPQKKTSKRDEKTISESNVFLSFFFARY